jgi:hypothetical protein
MKKHLSVGIKGVRESAQEFVEPCGELNRAGQLNTRANVSTLRISPQC